METRCRGLNLWLLDSHLLLHEVPKVPMRVSLCCEAVPLGHHQVWELSVCGCYAFFSPTERSHRSVLGHGTNHTLLDRCFSSQKSISLRISIAIFGERIADDCRWKRPSLLSKEFQLLIPVDLDNREDQSTTHLCFEVYNRYSQVPSMRCALRM
jgi:hypothetical protein